MAKTSCKKGHYYCNTDQKCKPIPDGYKVRKDGILVSEGSLRDWFGKSKSKGGKPGWVNVKTGGTCASDEPGEGVPKCVSRSKYDSMSKKEREYAHNKKRREDSGQQSKRNAAKPTYVSTDKEMTYKKKKKTKKESIEFTSLPLVLEVPQNDGEFKLGLMFRESLEQDRGMLFIFESDDYWTFHMKNTYIPLDIAFLKEDGTIDSIEELEPMSPVPVGPNSEIRYAVEVNRGWFAENDVNVGDVLLEEEDLTEGKDKKGKGSGTKDACYNKVKSRYSVWPSAYASGALVKCRKVGAANWGNKSEEIEVSGEKLQETENKRVPFLGVSGANKKGHDKKNMEKAYKKRAGDINSHYNWRDSFDLENLEEKTIAQQNSMQQKNIDANRLKAQNLAKQRIGSGTAKNPDTTIAQVKQQNQDKMRANAAANNQKFQQNRQQGGGAQQQQQGGGQQQTRKPGFLDRVKSRLGAIKQGAGDIARGAVSTVKRVAGGVADAATGNLTDFDKRGGKTRGLGRVVGGAIDAATGNKTDFDKRGGEQRGPIQGSRARFNRRNQQRQQNQNQSGGGGAQQRQQNQNQSSGGGQQQQQQQKMGATERANRERLGDDRVDALKAKNAEFQAAKKSGNLAQYRKDNPKLSGKERAQAMAKARIAAKNSAQGSQSF